MADRAIKEITSISSRCLMLDVDGVLISGRLEDGLHWQSRLHSDLGVSPTKMSRAFFAKSWTDVIIGKRDLADALRESLADFAPHVDEQELIEYWFKNDARIMTRVLNDCRTARARGLRIFLTTNQEHRRAAYLMDDLALGKEVDGIVYSAQAGAQKPDPDFYAYAQNCTGLDPRAHFLVDDTIANVEAARQAGWRGVHWSGKESLLDILRRHTLI